MRLIYLQKNIVKELLSLKKEKEASKEGKNNLFQPPSNYLYYF